MRKKIYRLLVIINVVLIIINICKISKSYKEYKNYIKLIEYNSNNTVNNPDIVGSITISGLSYYLLQTTDNNYYLNHDINNNKNKFGTIFMDYRCNPLSNTNCFIYAHSSSNYNLPFNILEKYKNKNYLNNNKQIIINYKGNEIKYEVLKLTNNYNDLDNYLYLQTCNPFNQKDKMILVAKKL